MNFGFLIFDGLEELDFAGPWEVISMWSKLSGGPENYFTVAKKDRVIRCANGLRILPDYSFDNCPPMDYLLIPGGQGTREEIKDPPFIDFVVKQAGIGKKILSVCTGALVLDAAGLLKGKKATTHWQWLSSLRKNPDIEVIEQRFVADGDIWTAAGVSAGIDMMLALVAEEAGEDIAGKVQLGMEYYPSPVKYGKAHTLPYAPGYIKSILPEL